MIDSLSYDLKDLAAQDISLVSPEELEDTTQANLNLLMSHVFTELPRVDQGQYGTYLKFPTVNLWKMPRAQGIPEGRKETRWEKFAQQKGIENRKRSRLVWDSVAKDWKPRWGYDSAAKRAKEDEQAVYEFKRGQDVFEDPFEKKILADKLAKSKQGLREIRNKVEAAGEKLPQGVPKLEEGKKPAKVTNSGRSKQEGGLQALIDRTQASTGSMGKFDYKPKMDTSTPKKTRGKLVETDSAGSEKAKTLKAANKLLKGSKSNEDTQITKSKLRAETPDERLTQQKKNKRRSQMGGQKAGRSLKNKRVRRK